MGSGFEKQRLGDMFRVPFLPHPEAVPDPAQDSSGDSEDGLTRAHDGIDGKKTIKTSKRRSKSADSYSKVDKVVKNLKKKSGLSEMPHMRDHWGSTNRNTVPSWIRDEQVLRSMGNGGMPYGTVGGVGDPHETPEHFKLFAQAQMEWWPFDVYSRVAMLYAASNFLWAVSYYVIGTAMSELRGFWIAWSCPGIFVVAQVLIFKLDVLPTGGNQYFPYLEWAGHISPFFTVAALTLDFRWTYTRTSMVVMWALVLCSYAGKFLMMVRFWDIANPDTEEQLEMVEMPGKSWFPKTWRVPSAFARTMWIIAPPKQLEKGKHDMLHEMQALSATNGGVNNVGGSAGSSMRQRGGRGKGAASAGAANPSGGGGARTFGQLQHQVATVDRNFEGWFQQDTWQQVSPDGQQELTNLHNSFSVVKQQVVHATGGGYEPGAGSSKYDAPLSSSLSEDRIWELSGLLAGIDEGLINVEKGQTASAPSAGFGRESPFSTPGFKQAAKEPWQLLRAAIFVAAFGYFWCFFAAMAEALMGTRAGLLKPPGEPPWIRDVKNRHLSEGYIHLSSDPPGMDHGFAPACPRGFCGNLQAPRYQDGHDRPAGSLEAAGIHPPVDDAGRRLLEEQAETDNTAAAFENLLETLPKLLWFGGALLGKNLDEDVVKPWDWSTGLIQGETRQIPLIIDKASPAPTPTQDFLLPTSKVAAHSPVRIAWPGLFEPKHLTCGPVVNGGVGSDPVHTAIAAITAHGFGTIVRLGVAASGMDETVEKFALQGVLHLGPLVGASWNAGGLQIVSRTGRLAECAGHSPVDGEWRCLADMHAGIPMPNGARLAAAAVASPAAAANIDESATRFVAVAFEGSSGRVALFACTGKREACVWRPAGDVRVPPAARITSLAFVGDALLVTTSDGRIHRRRLRSHGSAVTLPTFASAGAPGSSREWQASCGFASGGMARLALGRQENEPTWRPELFLNAH